MSTARILLFADVTAPSGRRILVVDDDTDLGESLVDVLELENYEARMATDAQGAVTALRGFPADVALLDIRLGRDSGVDLIARLRETRPNLACVMMTAHAELGTAIAAIKQGADEYLRKPLHSGELFAVIERCFEIVRLKETKEATERTIREAEERLRTIIEHVADSIITIDENGIIESANRAAARTFGYGFGELIGRNFSLLMSEPDRSRHDDDMRAYRDAGRGRLLGLVPREVLGQRKDGATFPLEISISEMSISGKRAFIGVARDITERKQSEDRLRHAQRMEAIGQLTGGVAHDFNNLLAVIIGNAEVLRERLGPDDKQVAAVVRAADHSAELTRRLLAFSRHQPLQPKAVDLTAVIANLSDMMRRTLSETIDIETVMADGLSTVEVDPGQLETALLNLVINAGHAMPEGGRLRIETANATVDTASAQDGAAPGRYAVVSVSDTGTGMTSEIAARAFEPFFTTKEVGEASGLGLSVVYGFAEQSGGFATIESREGDGTTVRLYLPHSGASCESEKSRAETRPPAAQGETILVVEDDRDVRALTVTLLAGLGYRVLKAADAASALDLLAGSTPVDLMLSDVVLAGDMSGPKLAEAARRVRPGLPVLFMSGYTGGDRGARQPPAAGLEVLHKPFRKHELACALRAALDEA